MSHQRYKIIILGMRGAGKTSLIAKKHSNYFSKEISSTVAVNSYPIYIDVDSNRLELVCWDTSGQEKYDSINRLYYQGCEAALIVYDITQMITFQEVSKFIELVREYSYPGCLLILIGTKQDLENQREVPSSLGKMLAKENNMLFIETSSETNLNIDEAFTMLARALFNNPLPISSRHKHSSATIVLKSPSDSQAKIKKKTCCNSGH